MASRICLSRFLQNQNYIDRTKKMSVFNLQMFNENTNDFQINSIYMHLYFKI